MAKKYLERRIATYVLALLGAVVLNFVLPRLIPGNPIRAKLLELERMGRRVEGEESIKEYMKIFSLDLPIHQQFINYIDALLHGNLGFSI